MITPWMFDTSFRRGEVGVVLKRLVLIGFVAVCAKGGMAFQARYETLFRGSVGTFKVDVRFYQPDINTVMEVSSSPGVKPYRFAQAAIQLDDICRWRPDKQTEGLIYSFTFSTGSAREWVVLTRKGGRIVESLRIDSPIGAERTLEAVDLDGDGSLEILNLARTVHHEVHGIARLDLAASQVEIYRWNPKSAKYGRVRSCRYDRRLEPLRLGRV